MVQYCRKCGKELEDDAEFCDSCGFELNNDPINEETNDTKESSESKPPENKPSEVKTDKNEFINKLPLILSAIAIIVGVAEGLGTPVLMGWDHIIHGYCYYWRSNWNLFNGKNERTIDWCSRIYCNWSINLYVYWSFW